MSKPLSYYLKLKFLPNVSMFLFKYETWARLRPLRKLLSKIDAEGDKRIIDVGAGSGRLEKLLDRKDIHIYDIDRDQISEAMKFFPNCILGREDVIDLPRNSYDWVISIHTLEHIPYENRKTFLSQIIDVAREGVYLNFPEGKSAELLCNNFQNNLQKKGRPINKWTKEHLDLGLPMYDDIQSILQEQNKFNFKYKTIRNYHLENLFWTKVKASNNRIIKLILTPIFSILCFTFNTRKPTIELLVVGTKSETSSKKIINSL